MDNRDPLAAPHPPHWPSGPTPPKGAPNIFVILFDDVGLSDFGCYGSPIATPAIDAIAARGLRYTGFHTTAMCSTTRAALLTGRNHHSVGMGCLANFDSGYPGYRGKIAREAGTIAEMLRPHGYNSYMVGKWHVTPLGETGPIGPFDGWPLARGFDHFYGFMDAETDQYAPELVRDNTPVAAPGTYESGYHLSEDLAGEAIRYMTDHVAAKPDAPFLLWLAFGACHAPHQAPRDLILHYDALFQHGWDAERERRLARMKKMGIVPPDTVLPPRNDFVQPWDALDPDFKRVACRLQGAYAAMLDHADRQIARVIAALDAAGLTDDTLVLVLSDNGASQEGLVYGFVNAMGPYNQRPEFPAEKLARIDDIGGPASHSNFPLGWAMAANTPVRRYKQNTHGGGIRDPLVVSWPRRIADRGGLRHQFAHAVDVAPTLLELVGIAPPETVAGVAQMPIEGESFAASLFDRAAPGKTSPQYFEMFGHRGVIADGWKAVAFHPPGTSYDADQWELFYLPDDFSEARNLAAERPDKLAEMIDLWWQEAEKHQVLPLDDRFGPRFAENAARRLGGRRVFTFHAGMGHIPTDIAPDLRDRSFRIDAYATIEPGDQGVLIAHGDATCGYSLYIKDGRLVYDQNVGEHQVVTADSPHEPGEHVFSLKAEKQENGLVATLLVDGEPVGTGPIRYGFVNFISWSGLDIGQDRASPVSHYPAPFRFTGALRKVVVTLDGPAPADAEGAAAVAIARE
ncbi:sulfatase-like hydrolase/transferase [Sphingomonas sp. MAH-20]|uniref:Sulfatase-like hydrolase/transferase n=1 Tax=Sphingomonas horti TaxID=2682842 RepID=A0A6I4J0A1_9SPHN|nr:MULTISPECIES: arylsulfatase [Sphingomonas]MBA2919985.1 arylsulfatase [Sphingomonas sp. CGMCC 1.13658]MVO77867.1 sulfatase-like hydrolase/transferase [Sphingomonas horti]